MNPSHWAELTENLQDVTLAQLGRSFYNIGEKSGKDGCKKKKWAVRKEREGKHTRRKGEIPRVNNNDFVSGGEVSLIS